MWRSNGSWGSSFWCGSQAKAWLQHLLANDVKRLNTPGRALYSAMLNEQGGVVDDMIVYLGNDELFLVVNAAARIRTWPICAST